VTSLEEGLDSAVLELEVGPVAHGGHCVARAADGHVVFVRHALPGERVRAVVTDERKGFLRADAVDILSPSPDRVAPPCPWAGPDRCGGCDFQHATPEAQRRLKADVVREQLARVGGFSPDEVSALGIEVRALPGAVDGLGWRTRVQYTVDASGRAGLLKHRSHEVVPVDFCRIAGPAVRDAPVLNQSWDDLDGLEVIAGSGGDVTVLGTRGRGRPMLVSGPAKVHERAVGRDWSIPADAFWQVHPAAADTLATAVVELLQPRPGERAWDLYGGAGLFAAALAPPLTGTGRITVVESDPAARPDHGDRARVRCGACPAQPALALGRPGRARPAPGRRRTGRGGADRHPLAPRRRLRGLRSGRASARPRVVPAVWPPVGRTAGV
jgi:tRNA/tmRNA/rRNA uracil-C5-methylase (TrmA/RlmC/RlmD family)